MENNRWISEEDWKAMKFEREYMEYKKWTYLEFTHQGCPRNFVPSKTFEEWKQS